MSMSSLQGCITTTALFLKITATGLNAYANKIVGMLHFIAIVVPYLPPSGVECPQRLDATDIGVVLQRTRLISDSSSRDSISACMNHRNERSNSPRSAILEYICIYIYNVHMESNDFLRGRQRLVDYIEHGTIVSASTEYSAVRNSTWTKAKKFFMYIEISQE